MIKAVIFDCDGLLIDTEMPWYLAIKKIYSEYNLDLPLELYAKCIGNPNFDDFHPYNFLKENALEDVNIDRIKERALGLHKEIMKTRNLRPGVREYLEVAKNSGYKIGLASSSNRDWIDEQLTKYNILHYFDTIHTGDTVEKVKPHPDLYEAAIKSLDVSKEEVLAFEDSINGLIAAKTAGIRCVIVPNEATAHMPFVNYDYHLSSMSDLSFEDLLERL